MSEGNCSCGGSCACKAEAEKETRIRRAEPGELVRCRWCHELPMIRWVGEDLTIHCDGGGGAKECAAYPSTNNGHFGHMTGYIVSMQWTTLNSDLKPQDADDREKLEAETLKKLSEK